MAVTPESIAVELGRASESITVVERKQWIAWIDRAERAITRRADRLGVDIHDLDADAVEDVVTYAVARRASRPVDQAESTTDQIGIDVASWNHTRRFHRGEGDVFILDEWWDQLGLLAAPITEWSGSVGYQ